MSKKLYKYVGPDILDIAFSETDYCGFKFSYPKDYNDPYELFLTIDFADNSDVVAFYNEIVQEIPQYPTTCFSKSPIVTPMWAHYAHNSKGFVIEVDEEKLESYVKDVRIDDVIYQDTPREELKGTLQMAMYRGKPRDIMFLRNGVYNAAYFTKKECWGYELERRVVVSDSDVKDIAGNMILQIPTDCITAIIAGPRTKPEYLDKGEEWSSEIDADFYLAKVGKSVSEPYFLNAQNETFLFNGHEIVQSKSACVTCYEPTEQFKEECSWCSISEHQEHVAAANNPLRALADAGALETYIERFNAIGRK
ncbi:hypothetical protein A3712_17495 [Vibrio sp. HI00D65]|uniref:DUF2971 domain-containing protein n=1 Tax=Vibrio sp. HI00D65 TaxID=1822216 RepID=UPI0007BA3290|nr:DUF2971 domain-containing protein [Vibrio sp. HI00D65]KZX65938.1 hypothetical protein A3712_17495 [Vibrio sp. HI00D65]